MSWQADISDSAHFAALRARYDRDGYIIFESVLTPGEIGEMRDALAPHLAADISGRNDFEGLRTNRIYALLAKSPAFAQLAIHPLVLAFAEADLGRECLLSACLAVNIHPGETPQPWHYDDAHYRLPRPRASMGLGAFWAIDDTSAENGATQILPGSHIWPEQQLPGSVSGASLMQTQLDPESDPGARADAVIAAMPAGSLMITKGTLWHRGGANRTGKDRLIITPQYCPGWTRQLENMCLAVPPHIAASLPKRAQELIGYSIHPPFMGYVDGLHPARVLPD